MCSEEIRRCWMFLSMSLLMLPAGLFAQKPAEGSKYESAVERARARYEAFKKQKKQEYEDFRQQANERYAAIIRKQWKAYGTHPPIPVPKIEPVPVFDEDDFTPQDADPIELDYKQVVDLPEPQPQPQPIDPVPEVVQPSVSYCSFQLYGTDCKVRVPDSDTKFTLRGVDKDDVATAWIVYSGRDYNNMLLDCLHLRDELQLSDWAYCQLVNTLSKTYFGGESNSAVVLRSCLLAQSGYAVRLGEAEGKLYMLVSSYNGIYGRPYWEVEGVHFYELDTPVDEIPSYVNFVGGDFEQAKRLDMNVYSAQRFAWKPSSPRHMVSKTDSEVDVNISVNQNLIDFYNTYPRSLEEPDPDGTSSWKFYANAALSEEVKDVLYPVLRRAIKGKGQIEAANIIIHFMQTTLVYGYDDDIWGDDRPFFAEETLYYPYSDCEDRAILFSRLVRDLLHLDVVLLYLPNHLAAAVAFTEPLNVSHYLIDGRKFYYCEATTSIPVDVGYMPDDYRDVKPFIVRLKP